MKIKKHNIIKSSLIKRIYSGIKSIKIYIDFYEWLKIIIMGDDLLWKKLFLHS